MNVTLYDVRGGIDLPGDASVHCRSNRRIERNPGRCWDHNRSKSTKFDLKCVILVVILVMSGHGCQFPMNMISSRTPWTCDDFADLTLCQILGNLFKARMRDFTLAVDPHNHVTICKITSKENRSSS